MKQVVILGSTGSVGKTTLSVIQANSDQYQIFGLVAASNVEVAFAQASFFKPRYIVFDSIESSHHLKTLFCAAKLEHIEVLSGKDAMCTLVSQAEVDIVVSAISGAEGLLPTLSAVQAGKKVLLANKESLVIGGFLFKKALLDNPRAELIPIDSEHFAIFQILKNYSVGSQKPLGVKEMILTASGGPFRTWDLDRLKTVTPEAACMHPIWEMGKKISVDSATLMNKGLELIEASCLFDMPMESLQVLIHPESIVHAFVVYEDGSHLAQLALPDMALPIASALSWPLSLHAERPSLDLKKINQLTFKPVETSQFPCLSLAYQAALAGEGAKVILNASNEVAVEHFLAGELSFTSIYPVIHSMLGKQGSPMISTLSDLTELDQITRTEARFLIKDKFKNG